MPDAWDLIGYVTPTVAQYGYVVSLPYDEQRGHATAAISFEVDETPANLSPFFDDAREIIGYRDAGGVTTPTVPDGAVVAPWGSHPWAVLPVTRHGVARSVQTSNVDNLRNLTRGAWRDVWSGNPDTDKVAAQDERTCRYCGHALETGRTRLPPVRYMP